MNTSKEKVYNFPLILYLFIFLVFKRGHCVISDTYLR